MKANKREEREKKGNWRKVIYEKEKPTSNINNGVYGFIDGKVSRV